MCPLVPSLWEILLGFEVRLGELVSWLNGLGTLLRAQIHAEGAESRQRMPLAARGGRGAWRRDHSAGPSRILGLWMERHGTAARTARPGKRLSAISANRRVVRVSLFHLRREADEADAGATASLPER